MTRQFVIVNPEGVEVDWIDPVKSFEETETHWIVDNTYNVYEIHKDDYPGHSIKFKRQVTIWEEETE